MRELEEDNQMGLEAAEESSKLVVEKQQEVEKLQSQITILQEQNT